MDWGLAKVQGAPPASAAGGISRADAAGLPGADAAGLPAHTRKGVGWTLGYMPPEQARARRWTRAATVSPGGDAVRNRPASRPSTADLMTWEPTRRATWRTLYPAEAQASPLDAELVRLRRGVWRRAGREAGRWDGGARRVTAYLNGRGTARTAELRGVRRRRSGSCAGHSCPGRRGAVLVCWRRRVVVGDPRAGSAADASEAGAGRAAAGGASSGATRAAETALRDRLLDRRNAAVAPLADRANGKSLRA